MRFAPVLGLVLLVAASAPSAEGQGHMPVLGGGFAPYGNFTANFTSEGLWIKTGPPTGFPLRFLLRHNATGEPATGLGDPRITVDWFPSNGDEMRSWTRNATESGNGTYGIVFDFPAAGHYHVSFKADHPDLRFVGPGMINIDDPPLPPKNPIPAAGALLGAAAAVVAALALSARRR